MMPLAAETKGGVHHHAHARNSPDDAERSRVTLTSSQKWLNFFDNNMRAP